MHNEQHKTFCMISLYFWIDTSTLSIFLPSSYRFLVGNYASSKECKHCVQTTSALFETVTTMYFCSMLPLCV